MRRRRRFDELVERQLALFAEDEEELLAEIAEAEERWRRSGREEAEERYGDFQLAVDAAADLLLELREAYAATLAEEAASEYRAAFHRCATRRFRHLPTLLGDLEP
jgi:hypothetical protein